MTEEEQTKHIFHLINLTNTLSEQISFIKDTREFIGLCELRKLYDNAEEYISNYKFLREEIEDLKKEINFLKKIYGNTIKGDNK